jgi:hypothetical protein
VLSETGEQHCPTPFVSAQWRHVTPVVGFVAISAPGRAQLEKLMGKAVIAKGHPAPTYPPKDGDSDSADDSDDDSHGKTIVTPCPPAQMRSDWLQTPRGMRMVRSPRPTIEHFHVTALEPLTALSATHQAGKLHIAFSNPLPFSASQVGLVVHYEMCHGKPRHTTHAGQRVELVAGETTRLTAPAHTTRPTGRGTSRDTNLYAARSVQVVAKSQGAVFDLDIELRHLGAEVRCPKR